MSLRMRDFLCRRCGRQWEEIHVEGDPDPNHCGETVTRIFIAAPGIHYKRRFSHVLNRKVSSYREEERELAKTGSWIATKTEANDAAQADHFDAPVTVQKRQKEQLQKVVERQAEKLVREGQISFRQ